MVQELAQILETMLSAILPVPLHYRNLEVAKTKVLKEGCSYDSQVNVKSDMRLDLTWWVDNAKHHNVPPLQITHWDRTIKSDASTIGWRASCQGRNTRGPWTPQEKSSHINYLELQAAFLALKSFAHQETSILILLWLDNVTAIVFLNRMGGTHSQSLSRLAVQIWDWCIGEGKQNVQAD